jgi:hypothetical protein
MSISSPPPPLIPAEQWAEFCEWAHDGGYDQSWFNRWDSKSLQLQQMYLDELDEMAIHGDY